MDQQKPPGSGKEKGKVLLSEEEKADIRSAISKCNTPEEARELRKWMAEYYRVTEPQIRAITAYKTNTEGGLTLKPQFPRSSIADGSEMKKEQPTKEQEISPSVPQMSAPQIEAVYDNPTKRAWREKIREAIASDFTPEELRDARVVCLPGRALQEVIDVYLPLGIRPENIVCIERDAQVASAMRVTAKMSNLPVTFFEGTVEDFLQGPHEPVTIASFDFLGQMHKSFFASIRHLRVANKCMLITNFLKKRERGDLQVALKAFALTAQETMNQQLEDFTKIKRGSEVHKISILKKGVEEHVEDILNDRTAPNIANARDEGLAFVLHLQFIRGQSARAVEELYGEVGIPSPLTQSQYDELMDGSELFLTTCIEKAFEKYPTLLKKLTPIRRVNERGGLMYYSSTGKKGFLLFIAPVIDRCFRYRTLRDVQRYEYSSENTGSPYQTDIIAELDWRPGLRQKNKQAYDFIRESFRSLGQYGREKITIKLERFGKILPLTYSGGATGVKLVLFVDGVPHCRVSLHDLQQLVDYYNDTMKSLPNSDNQELLARPRIKIKALNE